MDNRFLLPVLLGLAVTIAYALRNSFGSSFDLYLAVLLGFPLLLLALKKVSLDDLGLTAGKPLTGLFFVLFLPAVLFLRFYFAGASMQFRLDEYLVLGSFAEEFFFRGYLQQEFMKCFDRNRSLLATNLFFTLVHVVKGYSLLSSAVISGVGLYFSLARDKAGGGSTVYSMGAHYLYNLMVTSVQRVGNLL